MLDWESLLVVETTNSKNQISLGDHVACGQWESDLSVRGQGRQRLRDTVLLIVTVGVCDLQPGLFLDKTHSVQLHCLECL